MKTTMIVIFSIVLAVGLLVAALGFKGYRALQDFPSFAEKPVVYAKYEGLITELDNVIATSNTKLELASQLEKVSYPNEAFYAALETKDGESLVVFDNLDGNEPSLLVMRPDTGYGKMNDNEFVIINYAATKYQGVNCVVYLAHDKDNA